MRIGITIYPGKPLFESGANQTALQLGEMCSSCGASIVYLHSGLHSWWSDYPLPSYATEEHYSSIKTKSLDLLIDVDGTLVGEIREKIATRTVMFLRGFLQFTEMDRSVYIECPYVPRSMDAVEEVWCWDQLNPKETIPSIQTMFSCPIRRVPFFWSPSITEHFSGGKVGHFHSEQNHSVIHVAEKGTNESSCVIPLVAIREAVRRKIAPQITYEVHQMSSIQGNRFFKENVAVNIELDQLPIVIQPKKTHFYEWVHPANQLFFSHSRFTWLRPCLLHLVWMGIPLFHNSQLLRDLHPSLKRGYYDGNEIHEWLTLLSDFNESPEEWWKGYEDRREAIRNTFGVEVHQKEWKMILNKQKTRKRYVIAFSDMWEGFHYQRNTLMDALQHRYQEVEFVGVDYKSYHGAEKISVLMVGLFGEDWKCAPATLPKIQLNGENWNLPEDPSIHLFLSNSRKEDQAHMRFPTWMWFIDWYTSSTELPSSQQVDNPIRLPLSFATTAYPISFHNRPEFCAFVVSNPTCKMRNETFEALSRYKKVNSGGSLYNNIGGLLSLTYPGGGGGDLSKHAFFARHRFALSFENSKAHGYVTEKLLHAKMAGCLPIYWGDETVDEDFDSSSFLSCSHLQSAEQVVEEIKELERQPMKCEEMASKPLLDETRVMKAMSQLERIAGRVWELMTSPLSLKQSPWKATYVVNLDSRPDRWSRLQEEEPDVFRWLAPERISAINGRELKLTETIYKLFERNEFGWKKSVMGCALSHLEIWKRIAQQKEDGYYLVLEDDVRFQKNWWVQQQEYVKHIPEQADLVYLGGVLPPNRPALSSALIPSNAYWSEIKWNTLFTSYPSPVFHFCTYSYAIHRQGAIKLLRYMIESTTRFTTPVDHFLMSPMTGLTKYVATQLPAYCFQDTDPSYIQSNFNDLNRSDVFDSDICNNTDSFSEEERSIFSSSLSSCSNSLPQPQTQNPYMEDMILYQMVDSEDQPLELYERKWLEDMFQRRIQCRSLTSVMDSNLPSEAWYMVQRPYSQKWNKWFEYLQKNGTPFRILHMSDEFVSDHIECYSLPNCKGVVRNYIRSDIPEMSHIKTIPLGYHHKATADRCIPFSERKLVWSFHGTEWFGRRDKLEVLQAFQPNDCRFQPDWNHPSGTTEVDYLSSLSNSKYCPIMAGNNVETFRLYEALEAGVLPVTTITDKMYLDHIENEMGLSKLYGWENPVRVLKENRGSDAIQQEVRKRWSYWKERIQNEISSLFMVRW